MYLYLLEFENFVKVGITINLEQRIAAHKSNYQEELSEENSYFWQGRERHIKFIEQHIKDKFHVSDFRLRASGHTEIFNINDKEGIKNVVERILEVLESDVPTNTIKDFKGQNRGIRRIQKRREPDRMDLKEVLSLVDRFGYDAHFEYAVLKGFVVVGHTKERELLSEEEMKERNLSERFLLEVSLRTSRNVGKSKGFESTSIIDSTGDIIGQVKGRQVSIAERALNEEIISVAFKNPSDALTS